ncbi:MAG: AI-2E family transporter, partial [Candidatus Nanohaloarchaea archaeon]|nr:AI-2E family transporter [Candidatus Nanohaloarchaea archaeon]
EKANRALDSFIDSLPDESAEVVYDVKRSVVKLLRDVFVVYGTYGLIIGTAGAIGFYLIGLVVSGKPVPFFWAWGILIGLSAFIEGMAAIMFTAPLIAFYIVSGQVILGLSLLVFQMVFLGILPETFLLPYLGTRRLEESYLTIILGFLSGPLVFGLKGIVIGPVFVITLKNLLVSRFLES